MKKCPICYSLLPPKVIFCPVCGTELQTQVSENSESPANPAYHSFQSPSHKPVFRDEPVETNAAQEEDFIGDSQYAWKLTDSIIPLQMKGQINYNDSFKPIRVDFSLIKKLTIIDMLIIGSLSLVSAILLLLQVGLIGIMVFNLVPSLWSVPSILLVSIVFSSLAAYALNQKTAVILEKKKEIGIKINKKSFLSYLSLQSIHLAIIGLIVAACYGVIRGMSSVINQTTTIYALSFVLVFIISIVSPPLRISKVLSSLRESSLLQNLHDAGQFPKLSIKRSLELIGFTFLLPSVFIIGSLSFVIEAFSGLFSPALEPTISTWSVILFVFMTILLTLNFAFVSLSDVNTFAYYEKLMLDYIEPPDVMWIQNQVKSKTIGKNNDDTEDVFSNHPEREVLCPTCSTILIDGAEFCTDCGTKVTK
ncbi:MAG: hypothetical protein H7645_00465 [Candidatus Heimdallarchaeota archaeon]|nr:hypothetical protein [Candidatus Heimdallarchaeota archaeon]MCK4768786.1 hypothetical protein [Candidatus Heimdallarchaeota archaeon]